MDKRVLIGVGVFVALLLALPILAPLAKQLKGPDLELDAANQERIYQAVQSYGRQMGYYPPSLEALVPTYLESVPVTSMGEAFTYSAQTGVVGAPSSAPQEKKARGSAPVGGAGPMGEVMTGISIQEELN